MVHAVFQLQLEHLLFMNNIQYEKKSTPDAKQGTSKLITATKDNQGSALTLDDYVDVKSLKLAPQAPMTSVERKLVSSRRAGVRKVGRRGKGGNKGQRGSLRLPPEIQASVIVGHTFRFRNLSAVTQETTTVGELIGICCHWYNYKFHSRFACFFSEAASCHNLASRGLDHYS